MSQLMALQRTEEQKNNEKIIKREHERLVRSEIKTRKLKDLKETTATETVFRVQCPYCGTGTEHNYTTHDEMYYECKGALEVIYKDEDAPGDNRTDIINCPMEKFAIGSSKVGLDGEHGGAMVDNKDLIIENEEAEELIAERIKTQVESETLIIDGVRYDREMDDVKEIKQIEYNE